jgi:hypothetical protein
MPSLLTMGALATAVFEALQGRHHHPTSLSDVLEEYERSRTTAEWHKQVNNTVSVIQQIACVPQIW